MLGGLGWGDLREAEAVPGLALALAWLSARFVLRGLCAVCAWQTPGETVGWRGFDLPTI